MPDPVIKLWLSDEADFELLMQNNALQVSPKGMHLQSIQIQSFAELKTIVHLLDCFPLSTASDKGVTHRGAVWIDIVHPSLDDIRSFFSWLHSSLPISLLRKWMLESFSSDKVQDQLDFYPLYGCKLLRLTALHKDELSQSTSGLVTVSACVFDSAMISFRCGYLEEEEDLRLQLQRCYSRESIAAFPPRCIISTVLSAAVSFSVEQLRQKVIIPLLIETNTVDELALAIRPAIEDEGDLLSRMRGCRRRIHITHLQLLHKEKLIQQLLSTSASSRTIVDDAAKTDEDGEVILRYLHALTLTRSTIENIRRGRDTINLASMSVMSGVVARLGQHCHWMDYLNTLQSQIALIVMPINIIPGIMSCNVRVPFEDTDTQSVFWIIVAITLGILFICLAHPFYHYFRYALPGSIAPL